MLSRNGLKRVIEDSRKGAVCHVLSADCLSSLYDRLESDLIFSKHSLRKGWYAFFANLVRLTEVFQLVNSGPCSSTGNDNAGGSAFSTGRLDGGKGNGTTGAGRLRRRPHLAGVQPQVHGNDDVRNPDGTKDSTPLCLWGPHKRKIIRHMLRDFPDCPMDAKEAIYTKRAEEKARDGPESGTRSQTSVQMPITPSGPRQRVGSPTYLTRPLHRPALPW